VLGHEDCHAANSRSTGPQQQNTDDRNWLFGQYWARSRWPGILRLLGAAKLQSAPGVGIPPRYTPWQSTAELISGPFSGIVDGLQTRFFTRTRYPWTRNWSLLSLGWRHNPGSSQSDRQSCCPVGSHLTPGYGPHAARPSCTILMRKRKPCPRLIALQSIAVRGVRFPDSRSATMPQFRSNDPLQ